MNKLQKKARQQDLKAYLEKQMIISKNNRNLETSMKHNDYRVSFTSSSPLVDARANSSNESQGG